MITGADGFIGKALYHHIHRIKPDYSVIGVGRHALEVAEADYRTCDLFKSIQVKTLLADVQPSHIFHLAWARDIKGKVALKNEGDMTRHIFQAIEDMPNYAPRIILPGSAAEYGFCSHGQEALKETSPLRPQNDYGWHKQQQIQLALDYGVRGHDVVVGRIFNILGANTPVHLAAGRFAQQIVAAEMGQGDVHIHTGDLSAQRDFLDIDDICAALWRLAEKGARGEIYNICSGRGIVMRDFLKAMLAASSLATLVIDEDRQHLPGILNSVGDNQKLKQATGWDSKVSLSASIRYTLDSYRKNA